jgi:EF hand
MVTSNSIKRAGAHAVLAVALAYVPLSAADDITSFATGGYASGLRTPAMMHKIDTNGDGMISKDEWLAFQEKVFAMLDKDKSGVVDEKEFMGSSEDELPSFATGGYARGLRTKEMLKKIDTDGDGTISKDEWLAFQMKIFDMMDTSPTHKGMLDQNQFFGRGGK